MVVAHPELVFRLLIFVLSLLCLITMDRARAYERPLRASALVFVAGCVAGFVFFFAAGTEVRHTVSVGLGAALKSGISGLREGTALYYFVNNMWVSTLMAYYGAFAASVLISLRRYGDIPMLFLKAILLLMPVLSGLANGFAVGFLSCFLMGHPLLLVAALTPHGITEIPAILLSGAIGLRVASHTLANPDLSRVAEAVAESLPAYCSVVLLTAVSAYSEAHITPLAMSYFDSSS